MIDNTYRKKHVRDIEASILFVDDDPGMTKMLKRIFKPFNYYIATVNDAKLALSLMEITRFDVVVSDQRMPGMGGFMFLKQAHGIQPEAIKLMFSGHQDAYAYSIEVEHSNIHDFIMKPCFEAEIIERINNAIEISQNKPTQPYNHH